MIQLWVIAMSSVRIGLIIICTAAIASGWLSLRDAATATGPAPQMTRAPVSPFAATMPSPDGAETSEPQAAPITRASALRELESDSDAADVLAPTMTLDELLGALDADIGADGEPIDREAVGAWLRADATLSRMLTPAAQ